jgi:hypothetical protein
LSSDIHDDQESSIALNRFAYSINNYTRTHSLTEDNPGLGTVLADEVGTAPSADRKFSMGYSLLTVFSFVEILIARSLNCTF